MRDIYELVSSNKEEALDIIRANGGRIDFVEFDESGENLTEESIDKLRDEESSLPVIVMGFDTPCDITVASVRIGLGGTIEAFLWDGELGEDLGWDDLSSAVYVTENAVYDYLGEFHAV